MIFFMQYIYQKSCGKSKFSLANTELKFYNKKYTLPLQALWEGLGP